VIIPIELHMEDWERLIDILSTAADAAADAALDSDGDDELQADLSTDSLHAIRLYHYIGTQVGISVTKSNDLRFKGPSRN